MKSEGPSWDLISDSQYFISPETLPPRIEWRVTGGSEAVGRGGEVVDSPEVDEGGGVGEGGRGGGYRRHYLNIQGRVLMFLKPYSPRLQLQNLLVMQLEIQPQ